jgi:hypothetical protein
MRLSFVLNLLLLLLSSTTHKAWAQVVAPSRGGDVSVVQVNATSMVLKVGSFGTGQGRIVAIAPTKAGASVPMAPTNDQFYTGSSAYGNGSSIGSGFVVYSGTEHSVSIFGLQPETYYYIGTAEYNTDGTSIVYNTRSTNTIISTRKASAVDPAPLPVQLVAFTGSVDTHSVSTLTWTTASEYNSDYFAVERSTNGLLFTQIAQIAAAGTSSQSLNYRWSDSQPLATTTYYRLRQVDRNTTVNYSSVVTLQPTNALIQSVEVYPNPGSTQLMQVAILGHGNETFVLQLTDALGRRVFNTTINTIGASYQAPLGLPNTLAPGSYLCTLQSGATVLHKRVEIRN